MTVRDLIESILSSNGLLNKRNEYEGDNHIRLFVNILFIYIKYI